MKPNFENPVLAAEAASELNDWFEKWADRLSVPDALMCYAIAHAFALGYHLENPEKLEWVMRENYEYMLILAKKAAAQRAGDKLDEEADEEKPEVIH